MSQIGRYNEEQDMDMPVLCSSLIWRGTSQRLVLTIIPGLGEEDFAEAANNNGVDDEHK